MRLLKIGDEGVLEIGAAPRLDEIRRRPHRQRPARIHQGDAIAAGGLVHEMRRDENRHALIARKIDEEFPEFIARKRIDARGRLVENENFRRMYDGDSERQALADAERKVAGVLIKIGREPETRDEFADAASAARARCGTAARAV